MTFAELIKINTFIFLSKYIKTPTNSQEKLIKMKDADYISFQTKAVYLV